MSSEITKKPLPVFRRDLQIFKGPNEPDGSPTFNVYDPIRSQFYKIGWIEATIIKMHRAGLDSDALASAISEQTTIKISAEEVERFFDYAAKYDLLAMHRHSEHFEEILNTNKTSFFKWIIFHYLYIRIPLFNPDHFLTKTLKWVEPLGSRLALSAYAIIAFLGLLILTLHFEEFINTFTYFFNVEGFVWFALALTTVKIIHELSHAYLAKHFELFVPTVGIPLIVLWPVLYTDVTEGWKLQKRTQRALISLGGIIAETVIAGLASLGWALSPPGVFQSICFSLAAVTWTTSLLVNLNPAMRFDGYYILSDLWGIDNLQPRAFAITRWWMRRFLFGIETPYPELTLTRGHTVGLIIYSFYTWFYRLILYTAIAIFVYYHFTKALGIVLFLVEVVVFIAWPIFDEIAYLGHIKQYFHFNRHLVATFLCSLALAAWLIVPLPHGITLPAVIAPTKEQVLYAPLNSQVMHINVHQGEFVKTGELLISLSSYPLENKIKVIEIDQSIKRRELQILTANKETQEAIEGKKRELASFQESLKGFNEKKAQLLIKADQDGILNFLNLDLRQGIFLQQGEVLGKIQDLTHIKVVCFATEDELDALSLGKKVDFVENQFFRTYSGHITKISQNRDYSLLYPALASIYGGPLTVLESKNSIKGSEVDSSQALTLLDAYYEVEIRLDFGEKDLPSGMSGRVKTVGPWKSYAAMLFSYLSKVFWRESGL